MLEELIDRAAADDDAATEELTEIADSDPGRLTPFLGRALDADLLWPPTIYRAADAGVVGRVVTLVDRGERPEALNQLLLVLAVSRHPLAEAAMRRWAGQPPAGADGLPIGVLDFAREGGWTIEPDGTRRDLCGDVAYEWIPREAPEPLFNPACPWCSSPLWTVADLDGAEPALAHVGWTGRLRFRTCAVCTCYTPLFSQVTPDGGATWWPGNIAPTGLRLGRMEEPITVLPVVGAARSHPYQRSAWTKGGSTLGGHPQWIQDPEDPDCPGCGRPMSYVGLIGGADLYEHGEGAYYLHVHQPCGFTAVTYQQS
ncbi:hypothetical protein [Actinoplanes regularis]|uniref:hypothetical protein n=1 Tax=Actinoplanes regularis TaxID=52697 RepID=UPI0024A25C57|nr:hypothetical protein [Actinoplanes regularis]GLW35009.1 hypothetical protein Areg01_79450 [Actinoplanes regularis]